MLAGQVLERGVELQVSIQPVASAEIDLLICRSKIAVRQQHGWAKEGVEQKGAGVAPAEEVAAERERQLAPGISKIEAGCVRRAIERPVAHQGREGANGNIRERRI